MIIKYFSKIIFLSGIIILSSCARKLEIKINSYAINDNGRKFFIPRNSHSDLKLQECVDIVEQTLINAGYQKVNNLSDAELQIGFNYNMDQTITECIKPMNLGAATSYYTMALLEASKPWRSRNDNLIINHCNNVERSLTPIYQSFTPKNIFLYATKANDIDARIWELEITNFNSSQDLRSYFPSMLKCASPYIGKNYSGTVKCLYKD